MLQVTDVMQRPRKCDRVDRRAFEVRPGRLDDRSTALLRCSDGFAIRVQSNYLIASIAQRLCYMAFAATDFDHLR